MGLPLLYKRPDDPDTWSQWAFNHAAIHYTIVGAIQEQKLQKVTQYMLDPMDPDDLAMWLYQHQEMHNQTNAVLGTSGYDLLSLDWTDADQFEQWLNLNGSEHQTWGGMLGVG